MSEEDKPPPGPEPAGLPSEEPIAGPADPDPVPLAEGTSATLASDRAPAPPAPSAELPPTPPPSRPAKEPRPPLLESREALYREAGGFRMRLEPADLARLRELPGSKGRTDRELGEEFFEKQATRFVESLVEDVTPPAEVRVVVDPYSRQAFLAIERVIRSILSF